MNSTEVSSPRMCSYRDQKSQLARIEWFVFLTFLLSLILFPLGIVRKRYNSSVLKALALGTNAAIISLIPYIFGLMENSDLQHELVSLWAVLLFYIYTSVPNTWNFNDSLSAGVTYVKIIFYGVYVLSIYTRIGLAGRTSPLLSLVIITLWTMKPIATMIFRADITINSLFNDSHDIDPSTPTGSNDPLLRCKYIVYDKEGTTIQRITVQEIWGCEEVGCILSSSQDLKSYCLSLSLFRKLLPMFAGRRSYQSSSQQEVAWNLVRNGLLLSSSSRCPFRVIEVELAFLYDHIYNNSCCFLCYNKGLLWILVLHLMSLVGISLAVVPILIEYHPKEESARIQYHKHDVDVLLTRIVVIASSMLELVQLIISLSSRYAKMVLLCNYLIRESWKKQNAWDRCIRKAAEIILCPASGGGELFKPWQRQLGQYSLLDSYSYMQQPLIKTILGFPIRLTGNQFLRPGKKQSKSASLTNEIKKAVIQALLDRGPQLSNGIATLKASDQLPLETKRKLAWACTRLNTDAEVVLMWHIATSLCEINLNQLHLGAHDYCIDDFHVATSLSKYCAYLVAFAPNMLHGRVASTTYTYSRAIDEAYGCLKNCSKESDKYHELLKFTIKDGGDIEFDDPNSQRDDISILQQGAVLGKVLVTKIVDPRKRWKVLAGFWAEMILYLAPNDHNEWAHMERLADGGEFITHLWALLYHAGIVDRDSFSNKAKDAEADPLEIHQV